MQEKAPEVLRLQRLMAEHVDAETSRNQFTILYIYNSITFPI